MKFDYLLSAPTVKYCEEPIRWFIKRPFYAISNFAYILVSIFILNRGKGSKVSKLFGYTSLLIAILSFMYDATYTYITQIFDLTGMILFINILIFLNLIRLTKFSSRKIYYIQIAIACLAVSTIIFLKGYTGNIIFGIYIIFYILIESILLIHKKHKFFNEWLLSLGLFIIGFGFWILDTTRVLCVPYNILNGRGVFHILTSITIYQLYLFYEKNDLNIKDSL